MKRIVAIFLMVSMVFMVMAGCSTNQTGTSTTASEAGAATSQTGTASAELKVGFSLPLTGANAKFGQEVKDATTMYLEDINYVAGNTKIVPVWIDDQADPEVGTKAYEQAIVKDGIQVGMYCQWSSVAAAVMEVAAKYGIPHFMSTGASSLVNEKWNSDPKYQNWLKVYPTPAKLSVAYVTAVNNAIEAGIWTPAEKKYYIFGEDTDWGRSFGANVGAAFKDAGWEIVGEDYFSAGETDFYAQLSKMKNSGATLAGGTINSPASSAAFLKQSREINLKALTIVDALSEDGSFYSLSGEASDYVLDNRPVYLNAEGEALATKFKEKYGYDSSVMSVGLTYDSMNWLKGMIELTEQKKGAVNSETLIEVMKSDVWTGNYSISNCYAVPKIVYSNESLPDPVVGENEYTFPVLQFFGGKPEIVYPNSSKTKDLQIPDYLK